MAIDKPSLNDFLPNGFETQDKDGYKVNFDADKISAGYDKDTLEILSGPNLNNLLDNVGKNTHVLEQFLTFFRDMPIGSFPITNASNQLDYKSVNSFFRNVGELVFSAIPLEDGNLRLLDGSLLEYNMTYSRFITYIAGLRASLPNLFCTEQEFNQSVATYGVCGKFVYDSVTKSLRLPKISGFIKGTLDSGSLGDVDEAKAPNITGRTVSNDGGNVYSPYATGYTGENKDLYSQGALYIEAPTNFAHNYTIRGLADSNTDRADGALSIDASRCSSVYKNNVTTIEPQAIKEFIYMVVSIDEAEKQVLSAVYNYKGSVNTYEELPTAVAIGEVYNVIGEDPEGYSGANFAWTGEEWDRLGGTVNLSGYLTKVEGANTYATKASLESNVDYLQGQINTNASNIANIASQEVIDAGIQKIEMLKFASTLGAGKVADTDLFNQILDMKHSSFDVNKFTKIGSPNITKDGIASGFTTSNYLKADFSALSDNYEIILPIKWASTSTDVEKLYSLRSTYTQLGIFTKEANNGVYFKLYSDTSVNIIGNATEGNPIVPSADGITTQRFAKFKCVENGNTYTYTVSVSDDLKNWTEKISVNSEYSISLNNIIIGTSISDGNPATNSVVDLKYISIISDSVPVFSGNKQGMDVIMDDYEKTGNPTLSSDGILSNITANDYLYKDHIELGNNFEIISPIINLSSFGSTSQTSFAFGLCTMNVDTEGYVQIYRIYDNEGHYDYWKTSTNIISLNTDYIFKWKEEPVDAKQKVTFQYSTDYGETWQNMISSINNRTTKVYYPTDAKFYIGRRQGGAYNWPLINGTLDLKTLKVYNNNKLVYTPLLWIPYNLSKTGLKITNELDKAIYISDLCGFSQYYGIDEANQLCLVPQGENITGRRDLISRVEDSITHYVTEIYSDLYCKQMGSGTASTAVTLDIPYKDANYKLSVPQSAKSKTGFTPTASCDWTAEGYIYLDEVI